MTWGYIHKTSNSFNPTKNEKLKISSLLQSRGIRPSCTEVKMAIQNINFAMGTQRFIICTWISFGRTTVKFHVDIASWSVWTIWIEEKLKVLSQSGHWAVSLRCTCLMFFERLLIGCGHVHKVCSWTLLMWFFKELKDNVLHQGGQFLFYALI